MDVGKLFKLPSIPSSAMKRKGLPADLGSDKRARVDDEDAEAAGTAEEEEEDPGPLPEDPTDPPSDDEGRFFGGGLTAEQQQILAIMDDDDDAADERRPDEQLGDVRRQLLHFERAIAKNQEMRLKFPDAPERFITSEVDLDAEIRGLGALTSNCALFYPELVKHGAADLVGLLAHDNVDISGAVVAVLSELTDEDVLEGEAQEEDTPGPRALAALGRVLLDTQALELLVSNLGRFNDVLHAGEPSPNYQSDVQGVYHTLSVLENLISLDESVAPRLVADTPLIPWLLGRMRASGFDQNMAYAGELLAIVLQSARAAPALGAAGGIDTLLVVLARYRRRHHLDPEETEFVENCYSTLAAALLADENRARFLEDEGVELMVRMLRERPAAALRALQVLDHALGGGPALCERVVDAGGLGALFAALMESGRRAPGAADLEHLYGILSALLHGLASESSARLRLLAKFVEDEYAKTRRLLELRAATAARVDGVERAIAAERGILEAEGVDAADEEELFYLRRLEGGGFALQQLDCILAWLVMEDDGAAEVISRAVPRAAIAQTLAAYERSVEAAAPLREILRALREYVEGL